MFYPPSGVKNCLMPSHASLPNSIINKLSLNADVAINTIWGKNETETYNLHAVLCMLHLKASFYNLYAGQCVCYTLKLPSIICVQSSVYAMP